MKFTPKYIWLCISILIICMPTILAMNQMVIDDAPSRLKYILFYGTIGFGAGKF